MLFHFRNLQFVAVGLILKREIELGFCERSNRFKGETHAASLTCGLHSTVLLLQVVLVLFNAYLRSIDSDTITGKIHTEKQQHRCSFSPPSMEPKSQPTPAFQEAQKKLSLTSPFSTHGPASAEALCGLGARRPDPTKHIFHTVKVEQ